MQNDLISRSALLEDVLVVFDENHNDCHVVFEDDIENAPAVDAVEVGSCDGCYWKEIVRQQKCSCCRRNQYMKDNYERRAVK